MKTALVYLNNDKLVSRGVGYLLQAARGAGHDIDLIDTAWEPNPVKQVVEDGYDALLISTTSPYWERAKKIATMTRGFLLDIPICLGGIHATVDPVGCLQDCKAIDYICVGEGEQFITAYLNALSRGQDPKKISNIAYVEGKRLRRRPLAPLTDLETLPQFDFENWNPGSVIREKGNLFPGFCYVFATRGCPYRCSYCCNSSLLDIYGKGFLRTQKIDTVIAELIHLRDNYPLKLAYFGDEMITFNREYVKELFEAVQSEVGIPYGCMFRPEAVSQDFVDLLKRTGCTYVATGVECGDEKFRYEYLNRRYSNDQVVNSFRLLRKIPNIYITAFTMRGFPVSFDRRLTRATEHLVKRVRPNFVQRTWFYPLPGTKLCEYCNERDLINPKMLDASEDYFRRSVLKHSIPSHLDTPLYPRKRTSATPFKNLDMKDSLPDPDNVVVAFNKVCNYDCCICNHGKSSRMIQEYWTLEQIESRLGDLFDSAKLLNIGGCGELSALPYYDGLMKFLATKPGKIVFATNGYRINASKLRTQAIDHLIFSIHSLIPSVYDRITGTQGRLPQVLKNLRAMAEQPRDWRMVLAMVVTALNYEEAPIFAGLAIGMGLDEVRFLPLADPKSLGWQSYPDDIALEPNVDVQKSQEIANKILGGAGRDSLYQTLTDEARQRKVLKEMSTCTSPTTQTVIDYDGYVRPCCFLPQEHAMGNLLDQPWESIWNGSKYKHFRDEVIAGTCKACLHYCKNWG